MNWVVALPLGQRLPVGKPMTHKREAGRVEDDVDLMLRVKAGEAEAFNQLMEKYQRTVVNLVFRFTGDAENAEDLAQEVFLRIYRAAPRYEPKAKFFTYLYQVTLNLCRNERERSGRRKTSSLDSRTENDRQWDVPDPEGGAEALVQRQETATQVQAAILELPQEQRQLLVLQRFQDLGYEELAEVTSQTVSAVKAKLHRARLALKKKLEPLLGKERDQ
ncbi:sigma-70 family RNA polymerase sigma factor [bacterium]|nr:sigma-70 family RNA polymerase sigma factor [bacterium]